MTNSFCFTVSQDLTTRKMFDLTGHWNWAKLTLMRNALRTQHIIYISSFAALFLGIANVFHAVILYHWIYYICDVSYILCWNIFCSNNSRYVIALGLKVFIQFHSQVATLIPKMKARCISFDMQGTTLQNCSFVLQLSQQSVFSFGCALFLALKQ